MSGIFNEQTDNGTLAVKAWNDDIGEPVTRVAVRVDGGRWGMVLTPKDRDDLIRMLTAAREHTG